MKMLELDSEREEVWKDTPLSCQIQTHPCSIPARARSPSVTSQSSECWWLSPLLCKDALAPSLPARHPLLSVLPPSLQTRPALGEEAAQERHLRQSYPYCRAQDPSPATTRRPRQKQDNAAAPAQPRLGRPAVLQNPGAVFLLLISVWELGARLGSLLLAHRAVPSDGSLLLVAHAAPLARSERGFALFSSLQTIRTATRTLI